MNDPELDFSVSVRHKEADCPIRYFLAIFFRDLSIKSVFGFSEYTPLYGGRTFKRPELSESDLTWMYDHGIGYRIPLQNLVADRNDYEQSRPFLKKYHRKGNSVILVRPDLAGWVREDFPDFEIECSVINKVRQVEKVPELLKIYDTVVMHPIVNDQLEMLAGIESKNRIRLFANAGCMYRCPTMECYRNFSLTNKGLPCRDEACAQYHIPEFRSFIKKQKDLTEFDVPALVRLGFTKFKKLRRNKATGF